MRTAAIGRICWRMSRALCCQRDRRGSSYAPHRLRWPFSSWPCRWQAPRSCACPLRLQRRASNGQYGAIKLCCGGNGKRKLVDDKFGRHKLFENRRSHAIALTPQSIHLTLSGHRAKIVALGGCLPLKFTDDDCTSQAPDGGCRAAMKVSRLRCCGEPGAPVGWHHASADGNPSILAPNTQTLASIRYLFTSSRPGSAHARNVFLCIGHTGHCYLHVVGI